MLHHAQDIIRAHLVDAPRATNHQKLPLMNCLKTHSTTMRTRHKKLHRFLHMIIKKEKDLKKFRLLNLQNEYRELEQEGAVHMRLSENFARQMLQAIPDIMIGLVSVSSKLSEIYVQLMQE